MVLTTLGGRSRHLTLLLLFITGSCIATADDESNIALVPASTSPNTWATGDAIVLSSDSIACVIDSLDFGVLCTERSSDRRMRFGRRGAGPGEFRHPNGILRGPEGTIGVVDLELNRLTIIEPISGTLVSEVSLPGIRFAPGVASFSSTLMGTTTEFKADNVAFRGIHNRYVEFAVESSELVWERSFSSDLIDDGCSKSPFVEGMSNGVVSSTGVVVFFRCDGQMVFFADRDDGAGRLIQSPTYMAELPSERDVEEHINVLQSVTNFPISVTRAEERYRGRPKFYSRSATFDDTGRLWVLTTRDQSEFSYLDVYGESLSYTGTIRVRDRVVGFDLNHSTLVVLVDRQDAARGREIDWYDIDGILLGG